MLVRERIEPTWQRDVRSRLVNVLIGLELARESAPAELAGLLDECLSEVREARRLTAGSHQDGPGVIHSAGLWESRGNPEEHLMVFPGSARKPGASVNAGPTRNPEVAR